MINLNFKLLVFLLIVMEILFSCKKDKDNQPSSTNPTNLLPVVDKTTTPNSITKTSALTGGNIVSQGGSAILNRGVVFDTLTNPTILKNLGKTTDGQGMGSFTSLLERLTPGKKYFVKAYAENSTGLVYGPEVTFSTLPHNPDGFPIVETGEPVSIEAISARCGGKVLSAGDSSLSISEFGIQYSLSPSIVASDSMAIGVGSLSNYVAELKGLTGLTQYYFRAYAKNNIGKVGYGEVKSFSTPKQIIVLESALNTQKLKPNIDYLLKGLVTVEPGQILTIEPGTVIKGDKATKGILLVKRGGQIIANGTKEKPIIFTSNQAFGERDKGDWGGIIILGNANVNQSNPAIEGVSPSIYFGTQNSTANDGESSGILKFVRIEFAGYALSPNNETNGLTLGGVGSGTVIENVQVSYSGDDAFEWFGGTVNCKNLVAFATWDDDFDTDFGYTGKVQFAVSVREPFLADQSGSNSFESDNDAAGSANTPITAPVFSNVTVFGPRFDTIASISSNYSNAAHFRRNTRMNLFNSVISGFPAGIRFDRQTTFSNYSSGVGEIKNNFLISLGNRFSNPPPAPFAGGTNNLPPVDSIRNYFNAFNPAGFISRTSQLNYANLGIDVNLYFGRVISYPANPNFAVTGGVISTGANFSHSKLQGGFFQNVSFIGAFGATDWTDGWTNFNPQFVE